MNYLAARSRAFTLIELLVVIAIVAILAAILFPVFAQAKLAAKKTQSIANLKNIASGFALYRVDSDDAFPPLTGAASDPDEWSSLRYMYSGLVHPYIRSGLNFESSTQGDVWSDPISKSMLTAMQSTRSTFAYNTWGLGGYSRQCLSSLPRDFLSTDCTARAIDRFGDFASAEYNVPAVDSSLQAPSDTVMMVTGEQIARPPQYAVASRLTLGHLIGIYGSIVGQGDRLVQSTIARTAYNKVAREKLFVGDLAIVAYADGHAKTVRNASLWHSDFRAANGKWRGTVKPGPAMNKGWARQFPEE